MIPAALQCSWSKPEVAAQFTVKRSDLCQGLLATSRCLPYEADLVVPSLLPCHSIVGFPGFYKLWVSTFSSMRSLDNTGILGKYTPTARLFYLSTVGSTAYSIASWPLRGANGGGQGSPPVRHICFSRSDRYMVQLTGVMSDRVLMPFSSACTSCYYPYSVILPIREYAKSDSSM